MNPLADRRGCPEGGLPTASPAPGTLARRSVRPPAPPVWVWVALLFLSLLAQGRAGDWSRSGPAGGEAAGGGFRLRGAAGQTEAAVAEGGGYRIVGGFWHPTALGLPHPGPARVSQLAPIPAAGVPGSAVRLRGAVDPAGGVGLRVYWDQAGTLRLVGRGRTTEEGAFDLAVEVPTEAGIGSARWTLLVDGGATEDLVGADFGVVAPAPGRVRGLVRNAAGQGVGAGIVVRLLGEDGLAVAQTVTDVAGRFAFPVAPPGAHRLQVMSGGYPPGSVAVIPDWESEVSLDPADMALPIFSPVALLGVGAVALPGGSFSGKEPVQVGDWNEVPMARLVSLKGKSLPPLQVRFWAELQRILLPDPAPLVVVFELRKGGKAVAPQVVTDTLATVYPEGKLNVPAFTADFNSLELTPGKLTLFVAAFTAGPTELGRWEFPVDVVDLGKRWYAGHVKNPQLTVTRQDFFQLRYAFTGALPNLPGVGTPFFRENLKIKFLTLKNEFNLGIELKETFLSGGGWDGSATALANLTLFGAPILDESRPLQRTGATLAASKYSFQKPWVHPLGPEIPIPLVGGALPKPIEICGFSFGGHVGIMAAIGGEVALSAQAEPDLRLRATMTPGLTVGVPIGANLEFAVCKAVAEVRPEVKVTAPIRLDPWHNPVVYWDGLCLDFSAKAKASLVCCDDVGFGGFSVDIFPPFSVPSGCGGGAGLQGLGAGGGVEPAGTPPRHASIAYSPAGYAMAVWEHWERTSDATRVRTAPVYSLFDGVRWTEPRSLASPEFAGWEPQVGFLDDRRALVVWSIPGEAPGDRPSTTAGPQLQGLDCSLAKPVLDLGCTALSFGVKVAEKVVDVFCGVFGCDEPALHRVADAGSEDSLPTRILGEGPGWNLRPVLATHPATGEGLLLWLKDQRPIPGVQGPLGLYSSRRSRGVWSPPERVDPASAAFDLQPTVRFDPQGRPAGVWVRDLDGNLDSAEDRTLVFSRLDGAWAVPETLAPLPPSPWTPSLDFDRDGQPLVVFVVPPRDPETGQALAADGTLSTLHAARRVGEEWVAQPIGHDLPAERPVVRVRPDNRALVFFRGFGQPGRPRAGGEIATAVANLAEPQPRWAVGPLSAGPRAHWNVAVELNPTNGVPLALWETRDAGDPEAESELRGGPQPWAADLVIGEAEIGFSRHHPTPGQPVEIALRVVNRGLRPMIESGYRVDFFDREPERGVLPFATRTVSGPLGFGEELRVTAVYTPTDRAWRTFHVVVDAEDSVPESDETNNRAFARWGGLAAPSQLDAAPQADGRAVRIAWVRGDADTSLRHWVWRTQVRGGDVELIGATTGEEFVDRDAASGEEYSYRVLAVDSAGVRSEPETTPVSALPALPPPDPEELRLQVVSYGDRVILTWNVLPAVQLEAADELLGTATNWRSITEGVGRFGSVAQVTRPVDRRQRFFRLVSR
jgi:hypothetical protein